MSAPPTFRAARGFTLAELMVVVAIIIVLIGLSTGAMRGLAEGNRFDKALIGISAAIEAARQAAISKGTYTWVGMNSEKDDNDQNVVTVAVFESGDGTRGDGATSTNMQVLSRVEKYEAVKLENNPPDGNKLGESDQLPEATNVRSPNDTGFQPKSDGLPSQYGDTTFDWAIIFTPRGEATIDDASPQSGDTSATGDDLTPTEAIRFAIVSSKGQDPSEAEKKSAAVISVNGITGQVDVFQPEL